MKLYKSDWIGIVMGVVIATIQLFVIPFHFIFPITKDVVITFVLFGVITPPIMALITKILNLNTHNSFDKLVGGYVNKYFLLISYGLSMGIMGSVYHMVVGFTDDKFFISLFFGAAGVGFLLAYIINPALVYRPKNDAKSN